MKLDLFGKINKRKTSFLYWSMNKDEYWQKDRETILKNDAENCIHRCTSGKYLTNVCPYQIITVKSFSKRCIEYFTFHNWTFEEILKSQGIAQKQICGPDHKLHYHYNHKIFTKYGRKTTILHKILRKRSKRNEKSIGLLYLHISNTIELITILLNTKN